MKNGIVFIGWTSSQDLAIKVQQKLCSRGYLGIVGGNAMSNNSLFTQDGAIYNTVTSQMDHCNQAILLYGKRNNAVQSDVQEISSSLVFETGYLCSKFGRKEISKKVMIFAIGMTVEESKALFPGDLEGILSEFINTDDYPVDSLSGDSEKDIEQRRYDAIAEDIVNKFVQTQHKNATVYALDVLNRPAEIEREMRRHFVHPGYTDYQLAIALVYYTQSQYFHQTISHGKAIMKSFVDALQMFYREAGCATNELVNAAELSSISLDLFDEIKIVDMNYVAHLDDDKFYRYLMRYRNVANQIYHNIPSASLDERSDSSNEFYEFGFREVDEKTYFQALAITQALQHTTFLYLLNIDDSPADAKKKAAEAIRYGEQAIQNYDALLRSDCSQPHKNGYEALNAFYVQFMKVFTHSNLSVFYGLLGPDFEQQRDKHNALFFEQIDIIYQFANSSFRNLMNESLVDYISLEYFKAMRLKYQQNKELGKPVEEAIHKYILDRQQSVKYDQLILEKMKSEAFMRQEAIGAVAKALKGADDVTVQQVFASIRDEIAELAAQADKNS